MQWDWLTISGASISRLRKLLTEMETANPRGGRARAGIAIKETPNGDGNRVTMRVRGARGYRD